MNSFDREGKKSVFLKDKREIHLIDEKAIDNVSLSIISNGKTVSAFPLRYKSEGYGNEGGIYLSPSESYLLFLYFTGESEEGFTLFKIRDELEMVYDNCTVGEGASYCFSSDEKLLIQILQNNCAPWEFGIEDLAEEDEDGNMFYDFGYINIFDIERKTMSEHLIRVYLSVYGQFFETEYSDRSMSPAMANDNILKLSMPWGDETFNFPLKDTIILGKDGEKK